MDFMLGNTGRMLQKSMDYLWQKQAVTLNNIANQNTPNFKAQYVTFEDELERRLNSTRSKTKKEFRQAIEDSGITIHETENESMRMDGNNVDITAESAELARATLQYQFAVQSFNSDYTRIRSAIKGQ